MSISRGNIPRKGKDQKTEKRIAEGGAAARAMTEDGGRAACGRPPSYRGAAGFTAAELAELARADAEIDDAPDFLTPEERALSRALDREARDQAEARTEAEGRASPPRAGKGRKPLTAEQKARRRALAAERRRQETPEAREARLAKRRAWNAAHREELRQAYARYNEAHRQERRDYQRAYETKKRKEGNDGRKI